MVDGSAYATDLRGPLRITRAEISRGECVKSFISKGMDRRNISSVTGGGMGLWAEERETSRPGHCPDRDRAVGGDSNCNPCYFLSLWMSMTSPDSFTSIVT
jgi:hypothetical protein